MINFIKSNQIHFKGNRQEIKKSTPHSNDFQLYKTEEEAKQIRAMNLAASHNIKFPSSERPKALDPADREIILSDEYDKANKWTVWTDPRSGKCYTVIKKSTNPDGTITARILDNQGKLIKETEIKPKNIAILDTSQSKNTYLDMRKNVALSHAILVEFLAQRENPLANFAHADVSDTFGMCIDHDKTIQTLEIILKKLEAGEEISVINCSFGTQRKLKHEKLSREASKQEIEEHLKNESEEQKIISLFKEIASYGTKIVLSSGNKGKNSVSLFYDPDSTEFTGALNAEGKVADFSSTRALTKHYEKGTYKITKLKDGFNVTEKPGADIPYSLIYKDNKVLGMKLDKEYNTREILGYLENFCKMRLTTTKEGYIIPDEPMNEKYEGTSFAAPIRAAKLALNEAMYEILDN